MFSQNILQTEIWTTLVQNHIASIEPLTNAYLKRRDVGKVHPVHDFLFTYYNCSPQKLKQWVPPIDKGLIVDPSTKENYSWFTDYWFQQDGNILRLRKERLGDHIIGLARFVAELCSNILQRSPRLGCFGLHEWAMVYKTSQEDIRHKNHRLRLSTNQIADFIESQSLCCSHYDAYRFFTPEAQPLNIFKPTLDTRLQMEQSGCVHANMDLYKWSTKLWPWIGSDFIAKTFFLALEARELDMRASPYDLRNEGYIPICIETEEGRIQYQKEQLNLTNKANPLRQELRDFCLNLVASHSNSHYFMK